MGFPDISKVFLGFSQVFAGFSKDYGFLPRFLWFGVSMVIQSWVLVTLGCLVRFFDNHLGCAKL